MRVRVRQAGRAREHAAYPAAAAAAAAIPATTAWMLMLLLLFQLPLSGRWRCCSRLLAGSPGSPPRRPPLCRCTASPRSHGTGCTAEGPCGSPRQPWGSTSSSSACENAAVLADAVPPAACCLLMPAAPCQRYGCYSLPGMNAAAASTATAATAERCSARLLPAPCSAASSSAAAQLRAPPAPLPLRLCSAAHTPLPVSSGFRPCTALTPWPGLLCNASSSSSSDVARPSPAAAAPPAWPHQGQACSHGLRAACVRTHT